MSIMGTTIVRSTTTGGGDRGCMETRCCCHASPIHITDAAAMAAVVDATTRHDRGERQRRVGQQVLLYYESTELLSMSLLLN